jgi:F-type H+-transporting ATPase subunit gamma
MTRLAEIEVAIASMGELQDIVGAMRSLASMRVQQAQRSLPGIRRYAETMADAIGAALLLAPLPSTQQSAAPGRRALILCTAEQGFVGGFNGRILDAAEEVLGAGDALLILGGRGGALAVERGRTPIWTQPMATRPDGVPETIRRLTTELYHLIAGGKITRVEVMYALHRPGSAATIERRVLFPLDLASLATKQPRSPPLHNLPAEVLLEKLIADYVFALLTEAAVESLASENAARFSAMEAAHDNVSKKLDQLRQDGRQARQDDITTELLDLVTGAAALHGSDPHPRRHRLSPAVPPLDDPPPATGQRL